MCRISWTIRITVYTYISQTKEKPSESKCRKRIDKRKKMRFSIQIVSGESRFFLCALEYPMLPASQLGHGFDEEIVTVDERYINVLSRGVVAGGFAKDPLVYGIVPGSIACR